MTDKNPIIWGPKLVTQVFQDVPRSIQVSAHLVQSKAFLREVKEVFPGQELSSNVIVISTMQHAEMELVRLGTEVELEKDFLLEVFAEFAKGVCAKISDQGFWSDYIDPCSGLPMLSEGCNIVYNEVQSAQVLLSYSVMNASCCKVLLHPEWGSAVYPASIVTTAPEDVVVALLASRTEEKTHS